MTVSYDTFKNWRKEGLLEQDGVIVGCDKVVESMLPWWWAQYSLTNTYPVTFFNFGMSDTARRWCEDRGELFNLDISDDFLISKERIAPKIVRKWELLFTGILWNKRKGWFKKPLALIKTPYQRTIWIDIDCSVRIDVGELFETCQNSAGIALALEPEFVQRNETHFGDKLPGEKLFNSGVIVFKRGSPIIEEWATETIEHNDQFITDQHQLSRIIFQKKLKPTELSPSYNWGHHLGPNPQAKIYHWLGNPGKQVIKEQIKWMSQTLCMNLTFE